MPLYRDGTLYFAWRDASTRKIGYAASFNTGKGRGYHGVTPPRSSCPKR